ncbi:MAG: nucleotidyltransferase family protein [Candidatus Margulisbacteria bacterium]|nr:nucleotidyltransferase family protein [Candidatus Margulisiibacteriota bacterium]
MNNFIFSEEKIKNLGKHYGIAFLGIFGSYAHGDYTSRSDLDLLVKFSSRKGLLEMVGIERSMSQDLGIKVDLLTEQALSPYLKDRIMKDLKVVYDDQR